MILQPTSGQEAMSDLGKHRIRKLIQEIGRRRVGRTAVLYAVAAITVVEGYELVLGPLFGAPESASLLLSILAVCGFPIAIALAWSFELSPDSAAGRETTPGWRRAVLLVAVSAVCLLAAPLLYQLVKPAEPTSPADPTALRSAGGASESVEATRVAVLPFDVIGGGTDLQVIADQLHTRLIDGLSAAAVAGPERANRLRVASRAAILPLRDESLDSIRVALNVGTVVAGTVEALGERVIVRLELVSASTGLQLDRAAAEGRTGDPIALLTAVADSIVPLLRTQLGPVIRQRIRLLETENEAAFDNLMFAMRALEEFSPAFDRGDLDRAGEVLDYADSLFAEAERLDPGWIEPIVERGRLARRRARAAMARNRDPGDAVDAGIRHAERALALDRTDWRAYELRGDLRHFMFQQARPLDEAEAARLLDGAEADLRSALNGNPSPARVLRIRSEIARVRGNVEEALRLIEQAHREDPFLEELSANVFRGFEYSFALGRDSVAVAWCQEGRRRFGGPLFDDCHLSLMAWSAYVEPVPDTARAIVEAILAVYSEPERPRLEPRLRALVAAVLARHGSASQARQTLDEARKLDTGTPGMARTAAGVLALLGDADAAFAAVQEFLEAAPPDYRHELTYAPELRALRSDPRFARLLRRDDPR